MNRYLVEYDTGHRYGPASEEAVKAWEAALSRGAAFFLYPYCGYHLKMTVAHEKKGHAPSVSGLQREKAPG